MGILWFCAPRKLAKDSSVAQTILKVNATHRILCRKQALLNRCLTLAKAVAYPQSPFI
jgi:hypothetical protein